MKSTGRVWTPYEDERLRKLRHPGLSAGGAHKTTPVNDSVVGIIRARERRMLASMVTQ
jgi:hypothetical protein